MFEREREDKVCVSASVEERGRRRNTQNQFGLSSSLSPLFKWLCVDSVAFLFMATTHSPTRTHLHTVTHSLTRTHTLSFFLPLGSPQTWMTIQLKAKTLIKGLIFFTHLKKVETTALKKLSKKTIRSFNCFVLSQSVETSITT